MGRLEAGASDKNEVSGPRRLVSKFELAAATVVLGGAFLYGGVAEPCSTGPDNTCKPAILDTNSTSEAVRDPELSQALAHVRAMISNGTVTNTPEGSKDVPKNPNENSGVTFVDSVAIVSDPQRESLDAMKNAKVDKPN